MLLASCLREWGGKAAEAWSVESESGPLRIVGSRAPYASIAHSHDLVVCAVSDHPVGIDVEHHRPRDFDALAELVCGSREWQEYVARPTEDRARHFYSLWVLKEALLKCLELTALSEVPEVRLNERGECDAAMLRLFEPAVGYYGGLAVSPQDKLR